MQIPPVVDSTKATTRSDELAAQGPGDRQVHVGDSVRVRRQRWRVAGLRPYDRCTVVTLTGIGTHNPGLERRILTPFERVEALERPAGLGLVRMRRWRHICRALVAEDGPASRLRLRLVGFECLRPSRVVPSKVGGVTLASRFDFPR